MGEVNLVIQGKSYPIACDTGQEGRVLALGKYLDAQVSSVARAGAATEELHQFVLTGLILADRIDELEGAMDVTSPAPPPAPEEDDSVIVDAINQLAGRIDEVAERLREI